MFDAPGEEAGEKYTLAMTMISSPGLHQPGARKATKKLDSQARKDVQLVCGGNGEAPKPGGHFTGVRKPVRKDGRS